MKMAGSGRPEWHPGAVRGLVIAVGRSLVNHEISAPPPDFFQTLAERAEGTANQAIAEAIGAPSDDLVTVAANLSIVRRLLDEIGDDIFLAIEQADDAVLARLAAYIVIEGSDGYNDLSYVAAWGIHRDPEWGTIWTLHQDIRDFTPALLFKICLKGDSRYLAVEGHAPRRRLPSEPHAKLRARTMLVSGVPVLAFSSAEIETDAAGCVFEINSALSVLAQELLALDGAEDPPRRDFRPKW